VLVRTPFFTPFLITSPFALPPSPQHLPFIPAGFFPFLLRSPSYFSCAPTPASSLPSFRSRTRPAIPFQSKVQLQHKERGLGGGGHRYQKAYYFALCRCSGKERERRKCPPPASLYLCLPTSVPPTLLTSCLKPPYALYRPFFFSPLLSSLPSLLSSLLPSSSLPSSSLLSKPYSRKKKTPMTKITTRNPSSGIVTF
jgi:hypothetical protein